MVVDVPFHTQSLPIDQSTTWVRTESRTTSQVTPAALEPHGILTGFSVILSSIMYVTKIFVSPLFWKTILLKFSPTPGCFPTVLFCCCLSALFTVCEIQYARKSGTWSTNSRSFH